MLIPSWIVGITVVMPSLSRRVNANSQHRQPKELAGDKLIKKGEC